MLSRPALRILSTCGLCLIMSACGTDVVRMSEQLNPFAGSARFDPKTTGSLSKSQNSGLAPAADVGASDASVQGSGPIASAPLTAPNDASTSAKSSVVAKSTAAPAASQKVASLSSPVANAKPVASSADGGKWVAEGGTEVTLANDETIKTLSDRYGVPEDAIRNANGLKAKAKPKAGAKLIIPVHVAAGVQPTKAKAGATKTAEIAAPVTDASVDGSKTDPLKTDPKKLAQAKTPQKTDAAQPRQQAALEAPATSAPSDPANSSDATKVSTVGFRWPAKGRIIQAFGDKGGVKSTGINISVPEGTPIKAAEAGTVAYAGSEVKGFGNLVMVRHSDGWVSVYANASEIKVKRGDLIKRGQVIALSGQSGDVAAPQLHFELRKGSVPVDPVDHLSED
ncbi:MAG: M23 family metallopeptidase [Alphaproteobacteria bacterium]